MYWYFFGLIYFSKPLKIVSGSVSESAPIHADPGGLFKCGSGTLVITGVEGKGINTWPRAMVKGVRVATYTTIWADIQSGRMSNFVFTYNKKSLKFPISPSAPPPPIFRCVAKHNSYKHKTYFQKINSSFSSMLRSRSRHF